MESNLPDISPHPDLRIPHVYLRITKKSTENYPPSYSLRGSFYNGCNEKKVSLKKKKERG